MSPCQELADDRKVYLKRFPVTSTSSVRARGALTAKHGAVAEQTPPWCAERRHVSGNGCVTEHWLRFSARHSPGRGEGENSKARTRVRRGKESACLLDIMPAKRPGFWPAR